MLPWSVCVAFKTPVQELWAALTTGINSKALCSLQRIVGMLLGSMCIAFKTPAQCTLTPAAFLYSLFRNYRALLFMNTCSL